MKIIFQRYRSPDKCNVLGIGPGIGTAEETKLALRKIIENCKIPMVLDADAINIIATIRN